MTNGVRTASMSTMLGRPALANVFFVVDGGFGDVNDEGEGTDWETDEAGGFVELELEGIPGDA